MFKVFTCITVEHDLRLVALAGVVCFLACFAAVDLLRRARWSKGYRWFAWIAAAGAAGGSGVWATHFIAMLAYEPGFPVGYGVGLTALSLFAAIATMTLGLAVGACDDRRARPATGGAIIGAGVGLMHYLGMWALELPGRIEWSTAYVVASLFCGVSLASAAIVTVRAGETWRNWLGASILMTLGIVGLHFTAMAAARMVPDPTRTIDVFSFSSITLALGIAGVAAIVLAMSLMGALMDRKLVGQARQFDAEIGEIKASAEREAEEQMLRLAAAMSHMPLGLCILDDARRVVVCNASYERIYRLERDGVRPGMSEACIADLRCAAGSQAAGRLDGLKQYCSSGSDPLDATEELPDGRVIAVSRRPLPGGGVISTHEDITERLHIDQELRATRVSLVEALARAEEAARQARTAFSRLRDAFEAIPEGLALFDAQDRYVLWNARYAEIYAEHPDQIYQGMKFEDMVRSILDRNLFEEAIGREEEWLRGRLARHMLRENSFEQPMADGRWIQVAERRTSDSGSIAVHVDITELKRSKDSFQLLLQSNPVPMLVYDRKTLALLAVNDSAVEHYGYTHEQFLSMSLLDFRPEEDRARTAEIARSDDELLVPGIGFRHIKANGEEIEVAVYSRRLRYEGHDARISAIFDITERKKNEERIAYLAHHDLLTGLPNRSAFNERLSDVIDEARSANHSFAVLCLDLDRFKEVNDVFGHAVGDKLLRVVAQRFTNVADGGLLARVGGDEFILIATGGAQPAAASDIAESLLASAAEVFEIEGRQIKIGLSIGVVIYPDYDSVETLLANADAALYRAKAQGGGQVCFFDAALDVKLRERHLLLQDLNHALERGEFQLHYQPQANKQGAIIGFEALLRWIHPNRGFVPPDAFIPLAEESGLIIPIGEWVLREACREASSWARPLSIAVNLSPIQFRLDDLPQRVHAVLFETGLSADRLELEITEGVLVGDFSRATSILRQLKCLGVRIAMDDFGTGYSSLSYLQSFPFDKIKIDKSFVSSLFSKPQSEAIVRAIIGLGRGLGVPVIAEGVETEGQLEFLLMEGCEEAQGYLIGRPRLIRDYSEIVAGESPGRVALH